ncbi:MAG: AbiJ-NTD4 domain-containing protein [Rhodanobacteraceae bacterium]
MRFSQRIGKARVSDVVQTEGMSDSLRNSLWNVLDQCIWSERTFLKNRNRNGPGFVDELSRDLWFNFFKLRIDSRPEYGFQILDQIRKYFFSCEWYQVYDFIEFVVQNYEILGLIESTNKVLERELSGFRLIDGLFTPVSDASEREAIENALAPGPFAGVHVHLHQALQHLASRDQPDYRNSIKESISAIESAVCELSGNPKAALGDGLKILERGGKLHNALRNGFSAIYGYTSDAHGIRHAMLEEAKLDEADAKFFLVSSAAFINYLKARQAKRT